MARKTKDEAEKTRDAILDAAEKVFFESGVTRTSMEQIAAAAGVTRGAIYWHFKDKIEVCDAMAQRVFLPHEDMLEELAAHPSPQPLEDIKKSCLHALKMMGKDKRRRDVVTILMFRCEYVEEMATIMTRNNNCKERMRTLTEKLFHRAQQLKMLAPGWTPRQAAIATQAMMMGLIWTGLEKPRSFGFATTGAACLEAFIDSLKAR